MALDWGHAPSAAAASAAEQGSWVKPVTSIVLLQELQAALEQGPCAASASTGAAAGCAS